MKPLITVLVVLLFLGCAGKTDKEQRSDGTQIISPHLVPTNGKASLPRLFSNKEQLFLSWVEERESLNELLFAVYDGSQWTEPQIIQEGTDWFVNWADFPQFAENNGYLLSSYLKKSDTATFSYDIWLNHFNPITGKWKNDYLLHSDGTSSEHGFVSIQPFEENSFFISWLDGRNTEGNHGHEVHGGGAMTLRTAFLDSSGTVIQEQEVDDRVCDCCNTASTVTPNGAVVAYRDRSEDEIRDIAILRLNQEQWAEPNLLGNDRWQIPGCPVNGPGIDSYDQTIGIAWFSAANDEPKVQVAFSNDEGASFESPIRIDTGNATGRVDIVMLNDSEAVVSWMEPKGQDELIRIRRVSSNGATDRPLTIAKTTAARASGFPQLELLDDRLYVVWTLSNEGQTEIRMASVSLSSF